MQADFPVRRVRACDLDRLLEIEHAAFGRDAYDRKLFAEFLHKCGDLFLGVEEGGALCGYMVTCIGGETADILSLAVVPAARRAGAASRLMESTLRRLRRRGVAEVRLIVKVSNRNARALYRKYGFEPVQVVRGYYRRGGDGLVMARDV